MNYFFPCNSAKISIIDIWYDSSAFRIGDFYKTREKIVKLLFFFSSISGHMFEEFRSDKYAVCQYIEQARNSIIVSAFKRWHDQIIVLPKPDTISFLGGHY